VGGVAGNIVKNIQENWRGGKLLPFSTREVREVTPCRGVAAAGVPPLPLQPFSPPAFGWGGERVPITTTTTHR